MESRNTLLPTRDARKVQLVTNSHTLKFTNKTYIIYQYDITFDPPLPEDSRNVIKGCVNSVKKQLEEKLGGYYALRGKVIYGFKKLEGLWSFKCSYTHGVPIENVMTLSFTK